MWRTTVGLTLTGLLALPLAAAAAPELTTQPIKWFDADNKPILEPKDAVENQVWDIMDHLFFYKVGAALDLGWTGRRIAKLLRLVGPREADNVNALDEAPNSSWYTNRHFRHPMSLAQIREGPGLARPDESGPWEIVAGKFEGGTSGFTVKDATGTYFLLKFDSEGNNEMGSGAEVIATKILYAAGYSVPRNSVVYFDPANLRIGPKAKVPVGSGQKRKMTEADMQDILDNIIPQPDGRLRCVASLFLPGKPVGVFNYHGRRRDDANDRVDHQHRRELRGLQVIGSWINDTDRRAANTLDMYVTEADGRRYVKHYLIDMGSALGSNNLMPHAPKYGNEYAWDPRTILLSIVSLGFYRKPWEEPQPIEHPAIGYFENKTFRPDHWYPTYPNPAFESCTDRDAYWGAKIVMSFSDEQIRTMVETGRYSDPGATDELTGLLIERRDMIGRYWFDRVNPLDHFAVADDRLEFVDLAVAGGLEEASATRYQYRLLNEKGGRIDPAPVLADGTGIAIDQSLGPQQFHGYEIRTQRGGSDRWSNYTRVYFHKWEDGRLQIVRIEREG